MGTAPGYFSLPYRVAGTKYYFPFLLVLFMAWGGMDTPSFTPSNTHHARIFLAHHHQSCTVGTGTAITYSPPLTNSGSMSGFHWCNQVDSHITHMHAIAMVTSTRQILTSSHDNRWPNGFDLRIAQPHMQSTKPKMTNVAVPARTGAGNAIAKQARKYRRC